MSIHNLIYKLDKKGIALMLSRSTEELIDEKADAIAEAFSEIEVTVNVDDDWGICSITHINGREVEDC